MLMQTWKTNLIDISKLTLFNEFHKQPKSKSIRTVHQQLPNQEVHALNIVSLVIIASKGPQHLSQFPVATISYLEKLIFWKSAIEIPVNLQSRFLLGLQYPQTLVVILALIIFIMYNL